MTAFTFEDAEIVHTNKGGKRKEDNPFAAVISQIALTKDAKGKPVAKSFAVSSPDEETHVTDVNRVRRQLTEAGRDNEPTVSVQSRVTSAPGGLSSTITFWTIKRIVRKPSDDAA